MSRLLHSIYRATRRAARDDAKTPELPFSLGAVYAELTGGDPRPRLPAAMAVVSHMSALSLLVSSGAAFGVPRQRLEPGAPFKPFSDPRAGGGEDAILDYRVTDAATNNSIDHAEAGANAGLFELLLSSVESFVRTHPAL